MSVTTTPEGAQTPEGAHGAHVLAAPNTAYIITIAVIATLGGFLFGFDSGVINGTVDGLQTAFGSTTVGTGWSVSSMLLGSAAGALAAGRLADAFGRRAMLMVAAVCFIISAWGSGIATGVTEFVIYRIIGGLAVGAASVMSPAYISEIAPARHRGALGTAQQIAIVTGLFIAFLSNFLLARSAGGSTAEFALGYETWRWMFWVELLPAFIFLGALFAIPESPRFLVAKGKADSAKGVLAKLFGGGADAKVAEIERTLARDHKPRFSDLTNGGKIRPIVWVGIGLAVFQQLVGINVIFYYGAVLWQSAGFSEDSALLQNVLSGGISILAVVVCLAMIDRVGRKPFLFWGSIGMVVTLGIMCFAFSTGSLGDDGNLQLSGSMGTVALVAGLAYVFAFNLSWGPVMWVLLGEMFPNQFRGSALAVAGLSQWLANFLVTWSFPIFLAGIGLAGAYGIYAFFALVSVFFVAKMVRETKGMELEDMVG
ncbi:sugar porter family MFS transporter [Parvularcula dongshanensis]|uniref:SP family sugar:H+ symporter-like MFS transporter n=1 Tax=Parvularcula dongshanensis TaxID=1173995 RepID=A0A840I4M7_9PROT|nr:sugar porter family MFS transporter [Parvularcula dongshanensis]MBB4659285.1 SP family sugar:H+ symporter-like MFS transporter [Parvularcula dongshanensis]